MSVEIDVGVRLRNKLLNEQAEQANRSGLA
jgi:hypothetical protein